MEEDVEAIQLVRQEQIQERIIKEILDIPHVQSVSRTQEQSDEMIKKMPSERLLARTVEQNEDMKEVN